MKIPAETQGIDSASRLEGFLVGAVVGAGLAASTMDARDVDAIRARLDNGEPRPTAPGPGSRFVPTALADGLIEELVGGGVDLRRLSGRWLTWWANDPQELDPPTLRALTHLREFNAPLPPPAPIGIAPLAAALPAALTASVPQSMVAGAFHVAGLLDPSEEAALGATAMVVTAARFLEGRRDFLPDVIALFRANAAPNTFLDQVLAIPRDPRTPPPIPRGNDPGAVAAVIWLLWTAHHKPRGVDVMRAMTLAGGFSPHIGAVIGALMGARDGLSAWPKSWIDGAGEDVVVRRGLARRLTKE